MPAYVEKLPNKGKSIFFLLFAFLTIYFPMQLGDWELRWKEDTYAAIASEMDVYHPNTIAHGEQLPFETPMFPWLTAMLHKTGLSLEFCLRFISVFSVGVLILLAWEAGRRANDLQTAVVSAAMMCSSVIVIEKATDGYPHFTGLLFLFSAWLAWFTFGVARGKWNKAWVISFFFASMAFYTIGQKGILLFILPLIFMRRPMTVWHKLKKPGFFMGLALFLLFVLIWVIPRAYNETQHSRELDIMITIPWDYVKHLLTFPFEIFFRYLPWSIIAWPAFCVAYFQVDKNPIFSRFLRTIVISIFFFLWFSPFTKSSDIIFIAPPLSVLCGINYWLLVRRYGNQIHGIMRYFLYFFIILSTGIIIFYILPESFLAKISYLEGKIAFREKYIVLGVIQAAAALIIALIALRNPKNGLRVYSHILMICISGALCFWAILIPYRTRHTEKRKLGADFTKALKNDMKLTKEQDLPENLVIYEEGDISRLYAPFIYMGVRVKKIKKLNELPDINPVYMIFTKFPADSKRSWSYVTPKSPPYMHKRKKIFILKGTIIQKDENGKK